MLSPTLGAATAVHSACAFVLTTVLTQRMLTTGPDEDPEQRTLARMLHVAVTGRNAKDELIEIADLVTDMTQIKHPFRAGVKAQVGIEF